MKLRTKLALIAAGLTVLGLGLGLAITYWVLVGLRLSDIDDDNRVIAELVLGATLAAPEGQVPQGVSAYLVRGNVLRSAQVYHLGQAIWEGGLVDAPDPLDPEGLVAGAGARRVNNWRVHTLSRGDYSVQVGRSLAALEAVLHPYALVTVPLLLVLALLSGGLAWGVGGLALRPLETLTEAARHFEEGAVLPSIPGRDEASTLAASFSALLARLERERERERRFMAYAAHELRTPISALRASLEAAQAHGEALEPERLRRLHQQALRLEAFAQNLLALSRAEAGEVRAAPLDLAELAEAAYDRFQPLALEGGHELVLKAESAPTRGDRQLLEQALNNLVANALRYAVKGPVIIRSYAEETRVYLEVEDNGPGLPEPLQEGLGLRVARAVAQAHNCSLDFKGEGGTVAQLCLEEPQKRWRVPAGG